MSEIKTGVRLTLRDAFSQGIVNASNAGKSFGSTMKNVAVGVDKALSGVAGTLASIGVSIGAAATINKTIEFEDKLTRIGTVAGSTSEEIKAMKKQVFEAAMMPDIKMSPDEIVKSMDIIMEKTGNVDFVKANIENMARAMQGMNVGGAEIGSMMAEFDKLGYKTEEVTSLLDILYIQGNFGAFTAAQFAKNGAAIISAYSKIGTSAKDIERANAAMQILTMGTGDPTRAVTVLETAMQELADPKKQAELSKIGKAIGVNLDVRDANGQFRDFNDIMLSVVEADAKFGEMGVFDIFSSIFGGTADKAISAYRENGKQLSKFIDLQGTENALSEAAAKNAATLKSNLQNLQTAFISVANAGLEKPLQKLTDILNTMAEHPGTIKAVFAALVAGITAVAALKGIGMVVNLVNGFKQLRGGKAEIALGMSGSSGNGMPVFVTNWGGKTRTTTSSQSTGTVPTQDEKASKNQQPKTSLGVPKVAYGKVAGAGAAFAAIEALPAMFMELSEVNADETLSKKEKGKAKGGAVGATVGKIGGAAAGAVAGAAIGSVIPVIGTAIGALAGGAIGYFGGIGGRKIGEKIGESITKDDVLLSPEASSEMQSVKNIPPVKPTAELTGNAQMEVRLSIDDYRTAALARVTQNSTPVKIRDTGSVHASREAGH